MARNSHGMTTMRSKAVRSRMVGDSVVPEGDVVLLPLEAHECFLGGADYVVQVFDNCVALQLGNADNMSDESWVEVERLPAGHGVGANEWVLSDDWVTSDWSSGGLRAIGLNLRRVKSRQRLKILLHIW